MTGFPSENSETSNKESKHAAFGLIFIRVLEIGKDKCFAKQPFKAKFESVVGNDEPQYFSINYLDDDTDEVRLIHGSSRYESLVSSLKLQILGR